MSAPTNGGAAFPTKHNVHDPRTDGFISEPGMSLRDYFAGQLVGSLIPSLGTRSADVADIAYKIADAMLAERKKGGD